MAQTVSLTVQSSRAVNPFQKRGRILAGRLKLLNQYLMTNKGTRIPFSQFLTRKKLITVADFMQPLPADHKFSEIDKFPLSTRENFLKIREYANDLNALYTEQYIRFIDSKPLSAEGEDEYYASDEDDDTGEDSQFDQTFQDIKKKIKADFKANKITRKEKRQRMKAARKAARDRRKADKDKAKDDRKTTINDAKDTFKDEKERLKALYKSGKISKEEYERLLKEARGDKRDTIKGVAGGLGTRILNVANKLNPQAVVVRNAYLLVVKLNVANQAKKIYLLKKYADKDPKIKEAYNKVLDVFRILGGDTANLLKNADEGGEKKPPLGIGKGRGDKWQDIPEPKETPTAPDGVITEKIVTPEDTAKKTEKFDTPSTTVPKSSKFKADGTEYFYPTGAEEAGAAAASSAPVIASIATIVSGVAGIIAVFGGKGEGAEAGDKGDIPTPDPNNPLDPDTLKGINNPEGGEGSGTEGVPDKGGKFGNGGFDFGEHLKRNWYWYTGGFVIFASFIGWLIFRSKGKK